MKTDKKISLSLCLLLLAIFFISCSSRKNETDRSDIIPQDELTDIISDLYLTDGLITLPSVRDWYIFSDSISAYIDIIESHGYEKEDFDRTMRFYFIKKPKRLLKIYDDALARLSEMESRAVQEMTRFQSSSSNLWKNSVNIAAPVAGGPDTTFFDTDLPYPGSFSLSFDLTLFPDDKSVNPRFFAYLSHRDSIETGKRKYISSINYLKDGMPHRYVHYIKVPDRRMMHVRGWLMHRDNILNESDKHFVIENITFTSAPAE